MKSENDFKFVKPGLLADDDLKLQLRRTTQGDPLRNWVPCYEFDMRVKGQRHRIGRISLRIGDNEDLRMYAGHIGYGVDSEHRGNRYAARACMLLWPLALKHGIDPLWITCNPENVPSRRTCEIAGGIFIETVPVPEDHVIYRNGDHFKCRYRFDLESLIESE